MSQLCQSFFDLPFVVWTWKEELEKMVMVLQGSHHKCAGWLGGEAR